MRGGRMTAAAVVRSSHDPEPTVRPPAQSTRSVTDEALVAQARAGAEAAWDTLVERHHAAVYRTAHAALLSAGDAEEAAQDAWVSAWQHLDAFRGQASFRTWLLTIAWRKALDRRKGVLAWLRARRFDADDEQGRLPLTLTTSDARVDDVAIGRQALARVRDAIAGLPRIYRDALLLVTAQDLTYPEAADVLGAPVGTVKWRVSEARRLLRARVPR